MLTGSIIIKEEKSTYNTTYNNDPSDTEKEIILNNCYKEIEERKLKTNTECFIISSYSTHIRSGVIRGIKTKNEHIVWINRLPNIIIVHCDNYTSNYNISEVFIKYELAVEQLEQNKTKYNNHYPWQEDYYA